MRQTRSTMAAVATMAVAFTAVAVHGAGDGNGRATQAASAHHTSAHNASARRASTPSASTAPAATTAVPAAAAPGLSVKNIAALGARLDPLMAANKGCLVIEQGKTWLYDHNGNRPLAPASTEKLLLATAALQVLGPDYRFVTSVVAPSAPINGTVSDLWLVGGGDPLLATAGYATFADNQPRYLGFPFTPLSSLAASVAAAGVRTVPGGIHGDDSRYDTQRYVAAWPLRYQQEHDVSPLSALTLNEGYQSWTTQTIVPTDPPAFAASELSQLLAGAGVNAPAAADGTAPAHAVVIATVRSAPLSQIIGAMLRASDNQIAELLVKELGYHRDGLGTTAGGLAVEQAVDRRLGLPMGGVHLIDGSGLDAGNRATCRVLLAALDAGSKPRLSSLPGDLAVAGQSGTLVERFRGTDLAGKLQAKTGSIDNAGGMVGEIDLGTPVRFALLLNQPMNDTVLFNAEDAIAEAIAPYSAG